MHDTAREIGKAFFQRYARIGFSEVLDFGSFDINGTLREFAPAGVKYIGVDQEAGPGVDVRVPGGEKLPFKDGTFDMIVTSSVFEHDPCFWETFLELVRVLKPTGALYINAPSNGKFHQHPMDYWRFYPDAGEALVRYARNKGFDVRLVESFVAPCGADGWADFVAVFVGKDYAGAKATLESSFPATFPV